MDTFDGYCPPQWTPCDYDDQSGTTFHATSPGSTFSSASAGSLIDAEPTFLFPNTDGVDTKMMHTRKSVNKLGGMYTSGKPLPISIRRKIVAMSETGMKACDISRQLQISHGCVSKIISKWRSTGSFEPRRIGGSKPKKTLPEVIAAVRMYKRTCPSMHSLEIRRRLLADDVCTEHNVPSLSSINRIIRMKLRDEVAEFEASVVRDLMAILTGSSSHVSTARSPTTSEEMDTGKSELEQSDSSGDQGSPVQSCHQYYPINGPMVTEPAPYPVQPINHGTGGWFQGQPSLDPYSFPLTAPVPNDTTVDPSRPVFDFDFEDNVWSWLDQVP